MPNTPSIIGPYLKNGYPENTAVPIGTSVYDNYASGQVGSSFDLNGNRYTLVVVEAAVTALVANQVMYWKDKINGIVTNIIANAQTGAGTGAANAIAGICRVALASGTGVNGTLIAILVQGNNISVLTDSTTPAAGDNMIGSQVPTAGTLGTAAKATASPFPVIGIARGVKAANLTPVDVFIPSLP